MSTDANGLSNILESKDDHQVSDNGHNGHNGHTESGGGFLDPSKGGRQRIASSEEVSLDDYHEHNSDEYDNQLTGRSDITQIAKSTHHMNCYERIYWYLNIAIEGDLAGFQIAWLLMSIGFIFLKALDITEIIQRIQWWAIFVIPIFNAVLTAWFDYIIRQFRSTHTVESLRKSRFVVLWLIKLIMAIYVTTYWVWGPGSFMERYKNTQDFKESPKACNGQILCVYVALVGAVSMGEVMITTVLINSEQNLSVTRTPIGYRIILLIIRPFVWVYNRTMVMFLCFYAIYGLMYSVFVVALVADSLCDSYECADTQKVGLQMLTVPFTVPEYLTYVDQIFASWDEVENVDFLETFVIVFLCQSFYVDCLNSLWQFSRRYLKPKRSIEAQKSIHSGEPSSPVSDHKWMNDLAKHLPDTQPLDSGHRTTSHSINETVALKD